MPASPGPIRRRRAEFVVRAAFVCARPPSPVTYRPPPHCRLGRRRWLSTYWSRWGPNWFKCEGRIRRLAPHGALTKVNEGGPTLRGRRPASALQLPPQCRQASLGRTPRTSARRPIGEVQPIARIRLWPNDVRLDRLPKDYARCAAPGIVGATGIPSLLGSPRSCMPRLL
jgi:hypothetical protein